MEGIVCELAGSIAQADGTVAEGRIEFHKRTSK
jgi:hypothetical protein